VLPDALGWNRALEFDMQAKRTTISVPKEFKCLLQAIGFETSLT
jgi:hypothetical protein